LEAHKRASKHIILDLDVTDDPLHGLQERRFFHGYYDCYRYLPLYIFCGRHLLAAKLRPANIDASAGVWRRSVKQICRCWPHVVLRADSGFAREQFVAWCESNRVDYVFGLARNTLVAKIATELASAQAAAKKRGPSARCFKAARRRGVDNAPRAEVYRAFHELQRRVRRTHTACVLFEKRVSVMRVTSPSTSLI
jgi:hypothetical protein